MIFEAATRKSLESIDHDLNAAAARHKFGVIGTHNLKEKMREKGVDFAGECLIYEVCNPIQAKKVLEANPLVSTALPCRISVYRAGEEYRIATLLPSELMKIFGNPELEPVAREVEQTLKAMIEEAAAS